MKPEKKAQIFALTLIILMMALIGVSVYIVNKLGQSWPVLELLFMAVLVFIAGIVGCVKSIQFLKQKVNPVLMTITLILSIGFLTILPVSKVVEVIAEWLQDRGLY